MKIKQIIKNIGEFISIIFKCFTNPLAFTLIICPIYSVGKVLFDFENAIVNPTIKGNYAPIILFLIFATIILIYIGWIVVEIIIDKYKTQKIQLEDKIHRKERELDTREKKLIKRETQFKELTTGKNYLFGKIPQAISDIETLDFSLAADALRYKRRPAKSAAETVREYRNKAKDAILQQKVATYKLQALLSIFPQLKDYIDEEGGIEELNSFNSITDFENNRDYTKDYLSEEEWNKLTTSQRNQLALDRYIERRKKSNWAIGRDYEMACAHALKLKGFYVQLHGIEKKLEDLGRDLIANKIIDSKYEISVIQCKYWSSNRTIHENIIMQLYGTTIAKQIECQSIAEDIRSITPVLMIPSFSVLSETAQKFAETLNVKIVKQDLTEFPRIKCNINKDSKIYHLPFDQQYDRVQISKKGEFYAWTVEEAEEKGFRRAMRHIYT